MKMSFKSNRMKLLFSVLVFTSCFLIALSNVVPSHSSTRPEKRLENKLPILVQQICRHGDRAPCNLFPNNKHASYWVQGLGYLTPIGERLLYNNGHLFRNKWYPGLLNETILPNEVYVVSSNIDRAIMSVNSFMAALYPPKPTDPFEFQAGLNWQAFPTHTISPKLDYYIYGTYCPAWDKELDEIYHSDSYLEFLHENQDFIDDICSKAGYKQSDWTIARLSNIYDNLFCDAAHNLSLPDWATENERTRMMDVLTVHRDFTFSSLKETYLDTGGGPLLGLMVSNIKNKMAGKLTQKLIYYSGHDATVLPFMGNLEQPVGPNPPYSSCGVLELYEDQNKYFVQLVFRNSTRGMEKEPRVMPMCADTMCDVDTFLNMVQPKVNLDPQAACYFKKPQSNKKLSKKLFAENEM